MDRLEFTKEDKIEYYTKIIKDFEICMIRNPDNPMYENWLGEVERAKTRLKELESENEMR